MVNENVAVPPPGAGFVTVNVAVPAADRSAIVTSSVNPVAVVEVGVRVASFHRTVLDDIRFVTVTLMVVAAVPAVAFDGVTAVIEGIGFDGGGGGVDEPPPQLDAKLRINKRADKNKRLEQRVIGIHSALKRRFCVHQCQLSWELG